jgi:hypothetical protein
MAEMATHSSINNKHLKKTDTKKVAVVIREKL